MNRLIAMAAAILLTAPGLAQSQSAAPEIVDKYIAESWKTAAAEWKQRIVQDETMKACSQHRNNPPKPVFDAILAREKALIQYPTDGKFLGDWKKGAAAAQDGYGQRFTDRDTTRPNGANCYACHQLDPKEVSFGTVGPSLVKYGKLRNYGAEETKVAYERIYNAQASFACSNMPRFGHNRILTVEQIKDVLAFLMDPESPVNK